MPDTTPLSLPECPRGGCTHRGNLKMKFDGGRNAVLCEDCRTVLGYALRTQPAAITLPNRSALAGWLRGPLATLKRSGTPGGEFQIADEVIRFLRRFGHLPAESEDPRVAVVRRYYDDADIGSSDDGIRDLLARLDAEVAKCSAIALPNRSALTGWLFGVPVSDA